MNNKDLFELVESSDSSPDLFNKVSCLITKYVFMKYHFDSEFWFKLLDLFDLHNKDFELIDMRLRTNNSMVLFVAYDDLDYKYICVITKYYFVVYKVNYDVGLEHMVVIFEGMYLGFIKNKTIEHEPLENYVVSFGETEPTYTIKMMVSQT